MNRIIHTLSTSRTALILLLATLLTATAAQGAWAQEISGNWADEGNRATTVPQSEDGSTLYISTAEQLACYAYGVNNDWETSGSAGSYYCSRTVELLADIDLSAHYWTPIGINRNYYFNGFFHGNGHVISGMNINFEGSADDFSDSNGHSRIGLFGYLRGRNANTGTACITDLTLKDFSVRVVYGAITSIYVGGLVGACENRGDGTSITNCCVVNGSVTASNDYSAHYVGGLVGDGTPTTCTNNYRYNVTATKGSTNIAPISGESVANCATLTVSGHGSVAIGGSVGVITDGKIYAASGETVTLSGTPEAGYMVGYTASGVTITSGAFTMPANDDATVAATFTPAPAHFSVNDAGTEYTIHTATGWNVFCDLLADNTMGYFSGKTVQLGADITVTRMAGGENHAFAGTFDGGGYTLTVSITGMVQGTAPFCEIKGATIRNLVVTGSVAGKRHSAGLVGFARGDDASVENTIENCLVATDVSIKDDDNGYLGGIVGHGLKCKLTIRGCAFTGSLTSESNYTGGLQGWSDGNTLILENDIFAASSVNAANVGFHPIAIHANNKTTTATVTNVYYTVAPTCTTSTLIAAAGKQARTVAADDDVTIGAVALTGTATQYTVSGITAYSGGGLQRGQTLYYGSDDQLSLTLTTSAQCDQPGYQYAYTASAGTLSGTTLTMPNEDVTISVNTAVLAPIDWASVNQGTDADPYMIYNKDQLLLLAHRVNGTNGETANGYSGMYFKLGADITFDHPAAEPDDYAENYEAIGHYDGIHEFNGNFDGDGHTVSGIRINKTGSGDEYSSQGLFGVIGNYADIHDVHLTDARITGYVNVGGIAGLTAGTVSGCTVTDSYITATDNWKYGTIFGSTVNDLSLRNNYYHGCTVNGTAVTSGVGCCRADIADNHGALPAYAITLGANVTTPPGTFAGQTGWLDTPPVDAQLAPGNGFTLAGNHYFASGYEFTPGSTLASGAAQGYTPRATLGGQLLDLYTPTGNDDLLAGKAIARLTITADCDGKTLSAAIRSTGEPVTVAYINADGTTDKASAIALDGTETSLAEGTYFAGLENVNFDHTVNLTGDVTLILCDGCTMNVGTSGSRINDYGILGYSYTLDIYAQSLGDDMGALSIYNSGSNNYGIKVKAVTVNGGNITADANGSNGYAIKATTSNLTINGGNVTANSANSVAISSGAKIYINGGTVNATGSAQGIGGSSLVEINGGTVNATCTGSGYGIRANGSLAINGGNVTASSFYAGNGTITLGWTRPADRITASSISAPNGTVAVKDGQALTDGSGHIYTGTLSADDLAALAGKTTLQPWLVLNETDGVTPLTALAGQADVPVIFTRSGLTANAYSTMCLPFDFEKPSDCTFYAFKGVGWSTENSQWEATISETSTLAAHTPYIFKCSDTEATFIGTIASVPTDIEASLVEVGASQGDDTNWKFKGTYTALDWTSAEPSEPTYGFSTYVPEQTIAAGTFVRFVQGASLAPFRARLIYSGSNTHLNARGHSRAAQAESELPRYIIVRIIGPDGTATAIGTLDTATGQLSTDEWYTLGGRRLEAKPTAKGIYIHNGRKVIVK